MRDLEILLNKIYSIEIRKYFEEALTCYYNKAYKATVILSVTAGVSDLFNKVEDQYQELSTKNKQKFQNIETKKQQNQSFERELIDFCVEDDREMGIYSKNEVKKLHYCFDLRNSFAHPTEEVCTAEEARYVFVTMLDLVSTKKMLLGQRNFGILIKKVGQPLFYATQSSEEIKRQNKLELENFRNNKYGTLLKKILATILESESSLNYEYFASTLIMENQNRYELNDHLGTFLLSNDVCFESVITFYNIHKDIFEKFSKVNIGRVLRMGIDQESNREVFVSIINSIIKVCTEIPDSSLFVEVIEYIFQGEITTEFISLLESMMNVELEQVVSNFLSTVISDDHITLNEKSNLLPFMIKQSFSEQSKKLIDIFCNHLSSQQYSISNEAATLLDNCTNDFLNVLSADDLLILVSKLIEGAHRGGFEARNIINNLSEKKIYQFLCMKIDDCSRDIWQKIIDEYSQILLAIEGLNSGANEALADLNSLYLKNLNAL